MKLYRFVCPSCLQDIETQRNPKGFSFPCPHCQNQFAPENVTVSETAVPAPAAAQNFSAQQKSRDLEKHADSLRTAGIVLIIVGFVLGVLAFFLGGIAAGFGVLTSFAWLAVLSFLFARLASIQAAIQARP